MSTKLKADSKIKKRIGLKAQASSHVVHQSALTKGEKTRAKILGEAAEQFAEKGYSGTSVADIMSACGLTKGGFYAHFSSKEVLYLDTVRALLEREQSKYRRAPDSEPPERRLTAFLDWMGESLAGDRPLGRQFLWMVLEPNASITKHVIDEVFRPTYMELSGLLSLRNSHQSSEVIASSLLAVALLYEQIKAKIMPPLVKKKALAFDTAAVLEFLMERGHEASGKHPGKRDCST